MSTERIKILLSLARRLSNRLEKQITLCQTFVDNYSVAKAIYFDDFKNRDFIVNDFLHFCFAKSCKSLLAVEALIKIHCSEDALIILRSAYENYIHITYLLNHPESIDEFVQKKVGLHTGTFKYAETSRGKINRRNIIDSETNELLPFGVSNMRMLEGSRHSLDCEVYNVMYPFLSEHVHTHMMASGSYRDRTVQWKYTYSRGANDLQALTLSVYISVLLLNEAVDFEAVDIKFRKLVKSENKKAAKLLLDVGKQVEFSEVLLRRLSSA